MPSCSLSVRVGYGSTLSLLAFTIKQGGQVVDLTSRVPKFVVYDEEGNLVISETTTGVIVTNAALGELSYDIQSGNYADFAAELAADPDLVEKDYYAYWNIYNFAQTEFDTYPGEIGEEAIKITIFNPAATRTTPAPSIDIIQAANAPLRTRTVEGTIQERSIRELIEADRYAQAQNVDAVPWGMKIARTKPPSTLS